MKRVLLSIVMLVLIVAAVPAFSFSASVLCQGNICGGIGVRDYQYEVTVTDGLIYQLHVGTCDPNLQDYFNILMPAGWSFNIYSIIEDHADTFTPHGQISTPTGSCQWCAVWTDTTGQGVANAVFGFDNPNSPHDVGWFINSSAAVENWSMPVGLGDGPVHGPTVPEPSGLLALLSGLGVLSGAVVRMKK
ncbi:MAG: PEP-CTERM sorting domain-containing protein [Armatimonadota bacterium]